VSISSAIGLLSLLILFVLLFLMMRFTRSLRLAFHHAKENDLDFVGRQYDSVGEMVGDPKISVMLWKTKEFSELDDDVLIGYLERARSAVRWSVWLGIPCVLILMISAALGVI